MKRMLCLFLSALLMMSLAGTATAQDKKIKDTIVFAQSADATSLDPHEIVNLRSFGVYSNIYEGLLALDVEGNVVPALATKWEQVDEKTFRFTLRDGVLFHNGKKLTSEDVKFSFERMINSKIVSTYVSFLESVEVVDELTFIMHMKIPYSQLMITLTIPCCTIVSKKAVEDAGESFSRNPVGTGPYKFVEWRESESITLTAYENYWGDAAKTKNLIMRVIPEGSQRSIMLETGEVDVGYDILANDAKRMLDDPNLVLLHEVGQRFSVVYFKANSKGPIGNPAVRRALEYAIDKDVLVDAVVYGFGQSGSLYCTPNTNGYNAEKDLVEFNPDKAKQLLTEAGYPNGFKLGIYTQEGQVYVEIAQILQAQLHDIGIESDIVTLENNTLNQKVYDGEEIEMRISFYNNLAGDLDFVITKLATDAYGTTYFNEEVDKLRESARAAFVDTERAAIYDQFLDLMSNDKPWMTLYYEQNLVGVGKNVDMFVMSPIGAHQYKNVVVYE